MMNKRNFSIIFLFSLLLSVTIHVHATISENNLYKVKSQDKNEQECGFSTNGNEHEKEGKLPTHTKYITLNSDYLPVLKTTDWHLSQITPTYVFTTWSFHELEVQIRHIVIEKKGSKKSFLVHTICPNAP